MIAGQQEGAPARRGQLLLVRVGYRKNIKLSRTRVFVKFAVTVDAFNVGIHRPFDKNRIVHIHRTGDIEGRIHCNTLGRDLGYDAGILKNEHPYSHGNGNKNDFDET